MCPSDLHNTRGDRSIFLAILLPPSSRESWLLRAHLPRVYSSKIPVKPERSSQRDMSIQRRKTIHLRIDVALEEPGSPENVRLSLSRFPWLISMLYPRPRVKHCSPSASLLSAYLTSKRSDNSTETLSANWTTVDYTFRLSSFLLWDFNRVIATVTAGLSQRP